MISHPLIFICNNQKGNRFVFGVSRTFANLVVFDIFICMYRKWRHYTWLPQRILFIIIILIVARVALPNSVYRTKKSVIVLIQQAFKDSKKINFQKTLKIIYINSVLQYKKLSIGAWLSLSVTVFWPEVRLWNSISLRLFNQMSWNFTWLCFWLCWFWFCHWCFYYFIGFHVTSGLWLNSHEVFFR